MDLSKLSPAFHSPVRTGIMSILTTNVEADFNYLKKNTGTTDGNLSSHLTKLENLGFIKIRKGFAGKKTRTTCTVTAKGKKSFMEYLDALEGIIKASKEANS